MKSAFRKILGRHYYSLVKARSSPAVRQLSAIVGLPRSRMILWQNAGFMAADVCGDMGMGAVLSHVIKIVKYADDEGLTPAVVARSNLYSDYRGEDFLSRHLECKFPHVARNSYLAIRNEGDYKYLGVPERMPLAEAGRLFDKYFSFSSEIVRIVADYMSRIGLERFDLSIHYRGTDKFLEAPKIEAEKFINCIRALAAKGLKLDNLFLATDTEDFQPLLAEAFPRSAIHTYYRGTVKPGEPRHFSSIKGSDKAIEALVNVILISKATVCVRSSSYMSAWSKILNLDLVTHTLNATYTDGVLFPEREILEADAHARSGR